MARRQQNDDFVGNRTTQDEFSACPGIGCCYYGIVRGVFRIGQRKKVFTIITSHKENCIMFT